MRYMASIYISDVMDQVAATIELQEWGELYGPPEVTWQKTLVFPGIGEPDRLEWLARALFLACEEVSTAPPGRVMEGPAAGGHHTISGSGDTA